MAITPCRPPWPGTITHRERFDNQMHYHPVDRCFNREFGYWKENYEQWPAFVENGVETEGDAEIFFSFDPMPVIGGNIWMCPAFEQKVLSETGDINADGLTAEVAGTATAPSPTTPAPPSSPPTTGGGSRRSDSPSTTPLVSSMSKP